MKAIITVNAADSVGIMAFISGYLAQHNVNILDISQTIMQQYFVMIMLVDFEHSDLPFDQLQAGLKAQGEAHNVSIRIQREEIFNAMYRV